MILYAANGSRGESGVVADLSCCVGYIWGSEGNKCNSQSNLRGHWPSIIFSANQAKLDHKGLVESISAFIRAPKGNVLYTLQYLMYCTSLQWQNTNSYTRLMLYLLVSTAQKIQLSCAEELFSNSIWSHLTCSGYENMALRELAFPIYKLMYNLECAKISRHRQGTGPTCWRTSLICIVVENRLGSRQSSARWQYQQKILRVRQEQESWEDIKLRGSKITNVF